MAEDFDVKDWRNRPDTSTPINATSLEDMETRLAAYAKTQIESLEETVVRNTEVGIARGGDDWRRRVSARTKNMAPRVVMASPPTLSWNTTAQITSGTEIGTNDPRLRLTGSMWKETAAGTTSFPYDVRRADVVGPNIGNIWQGCAGVEFDYTGRYLEIKWKGYATQRITIWVNEQAHASTPSAPSDTSETLGYQRIDLGSRTDDPRRIRIEGEPGSGASWQINAIRYETNELLIAPSTPSPKVAFIGDSYGLGSILTYKAYAYPIHAMRMLGITDVSLQACVGSTGLVLPHPSIAYLDEYISRVDDVIDYGAEVVVIQNSLNDVAGWPAAEGQALTKLTALVAALRAGLPDVEIVVVGPIYAGALSVYSANLPTWNTECQAAAVSLDLPFINCGSTTLPIFSGTGRVGATNGTGNSDYYRNNDNVHFSDAGALNYFPAWFAGEFARVTQMGV